MSEEKTPTEILEINPEHICSRTIFYPGFEEAVIGTHKFSIVYSTEKVIEIIERDFKLSREESLDYFYHNMESTWIGDHQPIFVYDIY